MTDQNGTDGCCKSFASDLICVVESAQNHC